jgi:pimeloyl-ACP methyl ester carboxylesterase
MSFDRPGYGRSDPTRSAPTYAAAVSDVVAILDHFDIERAAMIGWSGGGPHALACGAFASQRVSSVTTICAVSGPDVGSSDDPEVLLVEQAVLADPVASRDRAPSARRCSLMPGKSC